MKARCCIPPESVRSGGSATSARPTRAIASDDELAVAPPQRAEKPAGGEPARGHDLADRRRRVPAELGPLREVAERPPPRGAVRRLAEEERAPQRRPLEAEDEPHERRLAAAVRAGDRDELALADPERDVLEHALARPVAERDAVELDG